MPKAELTDLQYRILQTLDSMENEWVTLQELAVALGKKDCSVAISAGYLASYDEELINTKEMKGRFGLIYNGLIKLTESGKEFLRQQKEKHDSTNETLSEKRGGE